MVLGSRGRYWLVLGGIGSIQGGNVCYMVVLGLYRAELDGFGQFRTAPVCTIGPICLSKFYKNSLIYDQV